MARRFRVLFWLVAWLGALPPLVSGLLLLGHFRLAALCSDERGAVDPGSSLRLIRLHQWGSAGALLAALLVIGYALGWAFAAGRRRGWMTAPAGILLLSALAVAIWSGRATPWRALEPPPAGVSPLVAEESGGPEYCLQHLDELRQLRLVYWLHVGSGALALALTLALTELAGRYTATSERS